MFKIIFYIYALTLPIFSSQYTVYMAQNHIGEKATICGKVVSAHYANSSNGKPTFLNIDEAYPKHIFTAVIWGEDREQFGEPEVQYYNKNICVTGKIKRDRRGAKVTLYSIKQLKISEIKKISSIPNTYFYEESEMLDSVKKVQTNNSDISKTTEEIMIREHYKTTDDDVNVSRLKDNYQILKAFILESSSPMIWVLLVLVVLGAIKGKKLFTHSLNIDTHKKSKENISFTKDNKYLSNTNINKNLLSTTAIARKHNIINAKPHFFNFLIEEKYLVKRNNTYEVTQKGQNVGGTYHTNENNEMWVVWDEDSFKEIIYKFKVSILNKYNISTINHMTHIDNLETILKYGLYSHNNSYKKVDISNKEVNNRRSNKEPIYNKSINEYVPFYFNPRNAMLYKVQKDINSDVIILGFSNIIVCRNDVLFTNKNAASDTTIFEKDITNLLNFEFINWKNVFEESWYINGENDNDIKQIMMAEVLVYDHVPIKYIDTIYCQNNAVVDSIKSRFSINNINIISKPDMFFKG